MEKMKGLFIYGLISFSLGISSCETIIEIDVPGSGS
jgi:hypothetical protein